MSKPEKIVVVSTPQDPSAAFDRIKAGVDLLANAVKITLGPWGRNVIIEKSGGRITNDGISVAREVQSKDEVEEIAIRIAREATIKTNEVAGDGTTTATTLVQAIMDEGSLLMEHGTQLAKESVVSIKNRLEKETLEVIEKLKEMATPITTVEQLIEVARVSSEDEDLAKLIGETQFELGPDGVIMVEENAEPVVIMERVKGIRIDNGLATSLIANDAEKQRLLLENVHVLYTNHVIDDMSVIVAAINQVIKSLPEGKRNMVIMARAFSSQAVRQCMENVERGIGLYPVQAPYVNQREIMKDMEAVLGGHYIHDESKLLRDITTADFGFATRVECYRYSATFAGNGDVTSRIEQLEKELSGEPSKFQKKAIETRLAQLKNGCGLLKIGSTSDIDRKYKFDKAEDAVNSVRSAYQEGTVPGAGLAYKEISEGMPDSSILKRPLLAPWKQIAANGGITESEFTVEPWVRNSVKSEIHALLNASRVAGDLITVGAAIVQEKVKPLDVLLGGRATESGD